MEYFKKISSQTVTQTIIDCPIRILEVAILQDSVDKDILGRVKFVNQSRDNIIAVFLNLYAKDISGEPVQLNNSIFIYQDIIVSPGEINGNQISICLPVAVRIFSVEINKVVFEDGNVWKTSDAKICSSLSLEQMELPKENTARIKKALTEIIPNVEYINYYYQENDEAWLCSCGRVNSLDEEICPFCDCMGSLQEEILTKDKFKSFCDKINDIVKKEKEEEAKKEAEEKQRKKEEENRKREEDWQKLKESRRQREEEHQKAKERNKKFATVLVPLLIVLVIAAITLYQAWLKPTIKYGNANDYMREGDYQKAYNIFASLNGFKDSEDLATECNYQDALVYMDQGDYQQAADIFDSLSGYHDSDSLGEESKDNNYNKACSLFYAGKYTEAKEIFEQLNGYKDSTEFIEKTEDDIAASPHISFDMNLDDTRELIETLVSPDSITINTPQTQSSYTEMETNITSRQAAQLTGLYGLNELKNIEDIIFSFDKNEDMNYIRIYLNSSSDFDFLGDSSLARNCIQELASIITYSEDTEVLYSDINVYVTRGVFEFGDYKYLVNIDHQGGNAWIDIKKLDDNTSSKGSSSKNSSSSSSKSSSSSSSTTHICQASGCSKEGTYSIMGLNGTLEYYCSEHYSQLNGMMDMILGD